MTNKTRYVICIDDTFTEEEKQKMADWPKKNKIYTIKYQSLFITAKDTDYDMKKLLTEALNEKSNNEKSNSHRRYSLNEIVNKGRRFNFFHEDRFIKLQNINLN